MPEGATMISAIDQGGNLIQWVLWKVWSLFI